MNLIISLLGMVLGHGRLMEPPGRSSLHRFPDDPFIAPFWSDITPNYSDNQLYCGGFWTQVSNNYRCGVCGDNFNDERPRENELGGKYGSSGIIPRSYSSGELINVQIQITAHHRGFFQFKLCKIESEMKTENEKCFNSEKSILSFENGENIYSIDEIKPIIPGKSGYWYDIKVKLPDDVECNHCVLQWRYHTGNSWGSDENGEGLGYGNQEEFYGCADIEIINTNYETTGNPTTTGNAELPTTTTPTNEILTTEIPLTTTDKTGCDISTVFPTEPSLCFESNENCFCENKKNGLYAHENCEKFYNCYRGNTYIMNCPDQLYFNPTINACDWPSNVSSC